MKTRRRLAVDQFRPITDKAITSHSIHYKIFSKTKAVTEMPCALIGPKGLLGSGAVLCREHEGMNA